MPTIALSVFGIDFAFDVGGPEIQVYRELRSFIPQFTMECLEEAMAFAAGHLPVRKSSLKNPMRTLDRLRMAKDTDRLFF